MIIFGGNKNYFHLDPLTMTLKRSVFLGIIIAFSSCNNQEQATTTNKQSANIYTLNCYRSIINHDTVILKTISLNGFMTGTLVYNFFEKDKSKGTIQGKMKDNLLIADYSYSSEGVQSVRQIAFKKIGESFIEGYGEVESKNGKTIFKNIDSLNFTHSIVLSAFNCEE